MKHYKVKHIARQAGMTLIELSVVLLILVGLAGLLIPYVGSFMQKTHDSTNSSNLAELNNAFGRYVAENNRLPQHMDTLVNDTAGAVGTGICAGGASSPSTTGGDPYCGLLDTGVFAKVSYPHMTDPMDTTAAGISYNSLAKSKIGMAINNLTTAPNKTFGSYSKADADMIMISNQTMMGAAQDFKGIKVIGKRGTDASMTVGSANADIQAHLAAALGKAPMDYDPGCYDYVAFGLGDANGLVTKTIASSPVHYPEDATKGPVDYYNHYMAIVQVDKSNGADSAHGMMAPNCSSLTEPAKFLGVVMNVPAYPGSHLFGVNSSLAYGYENQLAGK